MKKNRVVLVKKLNACGQTNIIGSSLVVLAKGIFRVKCTYVSKPAEKLCIVYGKHLSRDNGASSIKTLALWNVTFYVRCPISRWITKNHLQNTYVFTRRKSFPWDICLYKFTKNHFLLKSYPVLRNFSSPNYVIAFKRNRNDNAMPVHPPASKIQYF